LRLSQAWAKDDDLASSSSQRIDDLARCPQAKHDIRGESSTLVPPTFVRFEGIATHACDAVLWVFLGCTEATNDGAACMNWEERLVLEPVGKGASLVVGNVDVVRGGNSSGLFVPFALTRDDRWILLRAWMFSPGAGGGAVNYGIGVIARPPRPMRESVRPRGDSRVEVKALPARDPSFYADYGCAIGLAASDKTPTYSQPGFPSDNGGALVAVDLATLQTRPLLQEGDTTYSVERLDEKAGTIDVRVAKHTFGKDCPRGDGALSCSTSTSTRRTLALPPCAPAK
jgi:hypothetical protein